MACGPFKDGHRDLDILGLRESRELGELGDSLRSISSAPVAALSLNALSSGLRNVSLARLFGACLSLLGRHTITDIDDDVGRFERQRRVVTLVNGLRHGKSSTLVVSHDIVHPRICGQEKVIQP